MTVEARLLLGSDDAQSDSGHRKAWHWWYWSRLLQKKMAQGFAGGQGTATAELGNSGHEGGGSGSFRARWEGENMKCLFG